MNAATIAAIVAAVWAHPLGQSYLDKIDQIEYYAQLCGNPCCRGKSHGRTVSYRAEQLVDDEEIIFIVTTVLRSIL